MKSLSRLFGVYCLLVLAVGLGLPAIAQKPSVSLPGLANAVSDFNPRRYGAKGNSVADDRGAILASVASKRVIRIDPATSGYYRVGSTLTFTNLSNVTIDLGGASVLASDTTKMLFMFQNCTGITIQNGTIGYVTAPHVNGGGTQHAIQFDKCRDVLLSSVHVKNAPEIGAAFTSCFGVTVLGGEVDHCMRDGIYSRYCIGLNVTGTHVHDCKDDGVSFHNKDNANAGIDAEVSLMVARGYSQATGAVFRDVRITNCYQGVSSIGAKNLTIDNVTIRRTVGAGIAVFHIPNTSLDTTRVNNIRIDNCTIDSAGRGGYFGGTFYPNFGRTTTGRAAIFIGSLGNDGAGHFVVNAGESKRLTRVSIENTTISNPGSNGLWISLTDIVKLNNLNLINAANVDIPTGIAAIAVEMASVTQLQGRNNLILDTRPSGALAYGAKMDGVQISGNADELFTVVGAAMGKYLLPGAGIIGGTTALSDRVTSLEAANANAYNFDPAQYALKSDIRGDTILMSATPPLRGNFWYSTGDTTIYVKYGGAWIPTGRRGSGGSANTVSPYLSGLAGYYTFSETSGNLIDKTNNHNDGTITGSVTRNGAGNGYTFPGNAYITLPTNLITGNKFTIFGRTQQPNTSARYTVFSSTGGGGGVGISFSDAGSLDLNRPFTQGIWGASGFVTANTDIDFCITWDGDAGIAKFYKNGVLVSTSDPTSVTFTPGGASRIGDTGGDTYIGTIKLLGIYSGRVLNATEVNYVRNNSLYP